MISKEKCLDVFSYLVENDLIYLSSKDLKKCRITYYDMNKLLKEEILIRIQRGQYFLTQKAISQMYYLKDEVSRKLSDDNLFKVTEKTTQLKKNYEQFFQKLVLFSLENSNFLQAWMESSHLMHNDKKIYCYLLEFLMREPFYRGRRTVKGNVYEEFKIMSSNLELGKLSNQIRYKIANEQFAEALESLNLAISQGYFVMSSNELTKELLTRIQKNQEELSNTISLYLEQNGYAKIVELLEEVSKTQKLTKVNTAIWALAKDILTLHDTRTPFIRNTAYVQTDQYLTAIDAKDYLLAKNLIENASSSLEKIPSSYMNLKKLLTTLIVENTSLNRIAAQSTYQEMLQSIEEKQIASFLIKLRKYLIQIEKTEHERVVRNIIKLDLLNQNDHFIFTKDILTKLKNQEYSYSLVEQLTNFYQALIEQKNDIARVYLNILHEYTPITGKKLDCSTEVNKLLMMDEKKKFMNQYQPLNKKERLLLQDALDAISQQGIYLFKPMNQFQIGEVYQAINKLEGIYCFEIGSPYSRRIVAKSYTASAAVEQVKEFMRIGEAMYQGHEYDFAIFAFQQALKAKSMDAFIYARLGISCKMEGLKDLAVTYLTIAQELTRNKTHKYDFSAMIENLIRKKASSYFEISRRNSSQYVNNSMFKNVKENDYGISSLHQAVYAISKNIPLDEVVKQFNLSEEEKYIVLLITAREYYYLNNDLMGDRYFMQVEKAKNKSRKVISLFEEIRKKKRFYKNHEESTHQSLLEEPKQQKVLK